MANLFSEVGQDLVAFTRGNKAFTGLTLASAGFATLGGVAEFNANRRDRNSPNSFTGLRNLSRMSYGLSAASGLGAMGVLGHSFHKRGIHDTMYPAHLAKGKALLASQEAEGLKHGEVSIASVINDLQGKAPSNASPSAGVHTRGVNSTASIASAPSMTTSPKRDIVKEMENNDFDALFDSSLL